MMVLLGVDPNLVRPGWTPLVVLLLMGVALFFLGRSMLKQFRKIDVPADHEPATSTAGVAPRTARSTTDQTAGRTVTDPGGRQLPDLRTTSDGAADRTSSDRAPSDRAPSDRAPSDRAPSDRTPSEQP